MTCILLASGRRIPADDLIGSGSDGFVIMHGDNQVLKIPRLFDHSNSNGSIEAHPDNDLHLEHLEAEKEIYERLRNVPGIAHCIEINSNEILLEYYPQGSLGDYITSHHTSPPSMVQRWKWALQATECVARCHERRVLVFDIALRNFLLMEDFDLRMIDFANSALLELEADVSKADVDGGTAKVDIFHLSNVIYSILTWRVFSCRCEEESEWPSLDQMPDLSGVDCGQVIRDCWLMRYGSVQELALELRKCAGKCSE
jgi:serine/threonine protein kinase